MIDYKINRLEQSARVLAVALGIVLWLAATRVKVVDPLVFVVGSGLAFIGLNGSRFNSFSIGRDGAMKFDNLPEEIAAKANSENTIRVDTPEEMPKELYEEAGSIDTFINTDGMGGVTIVYPGEQVIAGIGKTLTASGITGYKSGEEIVGIGLLESETSDPSEVLVLGGNGKTFKITYTSPKNQEGSGPCDGGVK